MADGRRVRRADHKLMALGVQLTAASACIVEALMMEQMAEGRHQVGRRRDDSGHPRSDARSGVGYEVGVLDCLFARWVSWIADTHSVSAPSPSKASKATRRNLTPRVAEANKWLRIEGLGRPKSFDDAYPGARARFMKGDRDVEFPAGTYRLVKHAGARCAAPVTRSLFVASIAPIDGPKGRDGLAAGVGR
jgi:hypothetical protein